MVIQKIITQRNSYCLKFMNKNKILFINPSFQQLYYICCEYISRFNKISELNYFPDIAFLFTYHEIPRITNLREISHNWLKGHNFYSVFTNDIQEANQFSLYDIAIICDLTGKIDQIMFEIEFILSNGLKVYYEISDYIFYPTEKDIVYYKNSPANMITKDKHVSQLIYIDQLLQYRSIVKSYLVKRLITHSLYQDAYLCDFISNSDANSNRKESLIKKDKGVAELMTFNKGWLTLDSYARQIFDRFEFKSKSDKMENELLEYTSFINGFDLLKIPFSKHYVKNNNPKYINIKGENNNGYKLYGSFERYFDPFWTKASEMLK